MTGRLARENATRKPGRTAVTAAALMIGVAMVTFVTVFASGITSSMADSIQKGIKGDLFVQNSDGFSPIPAAMPAEVAARARASTRSAPSAASQAKVIGAKEKREYVGRRASPGPSADDVQARVRGGLGGDAARR